LSGRDSNGCLSRTSRTQNLGATQPQERAFVAHALPLRSPPPFARHAFLPSTSATPKPVEAGRRTICANSNSGIRKSPRVSTLPRGTLGGLQTFPRREHHRSPGAGKRRAGRATGSMGSGGKRRSACVGKGASAGSVRAPRAARAATSMPLQRQETSRVGRRRRKRDQAEREGRHRTNSTGQGEPRVSAVFRRGFEGHDLATFF